MKKEVQMGIFLVIFLTIYFLIHYFVISYYFSYFSSGKDFIFYLTTFLLTISYPLAMVIEKKFKNRTAKYFYLFSAIWMGFLFISFFIILVFNIFNLFISLEEHVSKAIVLLLSITVSFYSLINGNTLNIKNIKFPFKGLKKNIRIVQLSDIHIGSINRKRYLERIIKKTNEQKPDIVVITGDLVDGSAPIDNDIIAPIKNIKAETFYVIGNHEIYEGLDKIMPILEKTKMNILRDEIVKYKGITFIGIDYREGNSFINEKIKDYKMNKDSLSILLYHAPSLKVETLSKNNIFLHLSGHTHHGQIFPFNFLVRLAFSYVKGLHISKDKKSNLYISPGTGTWGPPMRLGSKCELTVIDITKS